jgi:hypothetical protein
VGKSATKASRNKMPVSAACSETRGRPPRRRARKQRLETRPQRIVQEGLCHADRTKSTAQVQTAQVQTAQVQTAQVQTAQVQTAQVQTAQVQEISQRF